jgi:uroporphyrinogen-III decarboxylase
MVSDYAVFAGGSKRLVAALKGEPGPVPLFAQTHEYAAARAGISPRAFYTRADILVPALLEAQASLGLDVAELSYDVYNIEAEALGQAILFTETGSPDIDRAHPLVQGPGDLTKIRTPDFERDGRFAVVIEMMRRFENMTGVPPTLRFCAPFSLAASLRGIESLLIDIYQAPDFARTLLERLTEEVLAPWILYQRDCLPSATSISGADALASLPIVNLTILRDWVVPWIERLRALVSPQVSVVNWVGERCLKKPVEMLDLKLEVGTGSLRGQDPDVEILGPRFYRQYAEKHHQSLVLGLGAAFLAEARPDQVTERVERYIREGRASTGFALYLCNIGASTPPENIAAAVRAAHNA